jgi:hypothetical protein
VADRLTSGGVTGMRAAVKAGLGVAPHSTRVLPSGLAPLPAAAGLPSMGEVEFVGLGPGRGHDVATALQETILTSAAELQGSHGLSFGPR